MNNEVMRAVAGSWFRKPQKVEKAGSTEFRASWISFVAGDDLKPSKEKIAELQRISGEVRAEILRSDTDRWPYVEIVTE